MLQSSQDVGVGISAPFSRLWRKSCLRPAHLRGEGRVRKCKLQLLATQRSPSLSETAAHRVHSVFVSASPRFTTVNMRTATVYMFSCSSGDRNLLWFSVVSSFLLFHCVDLYKAKLLPIGIYKLYGIKIRMNTVFLH